MLHKSNRKDHFQTQRQLVVDLLHVIMQLRQFHEVTGRLLQVEEPPQLAINAECPSKVA